MSDFFDLMEDMEDDDTNAEHAVVAASPHTADIDTASTSACSSTGSSALWLNDADANRSTIAARAGRGRGPRGHALPVRTRRSGCPGCGRVYGVSKDFVDLAKPVRWHHSDGAGKWCLDCTSTWRVAHAGTYSSLVIFEKVYLADEINKAAWTYELVAYISLAKEGVVKIRPGDLVNRVELLKWVLQMLSLPTRGFAVQRLEDAVRSEGGVKAIDPSRLVTLLGPLGSEIAVLVENDPDDSMRANLLTRPVVRNLVERLPALSVLSSERAEDAAFLSQIAGGGNVESICTELVPYELPGKAKTPLDVKTDGVLKMAAAALQPFSKPTWVYILESELKKPKANILSHLADVQAYGNAELTQRVESWAYGVTNAKLFLKHHRDYVKGKRSNDKLMTFSEVTKALVSFVDSSPVGASLTIAASLRVLYLKTIYLEASAKHGGLVAPLQAVLAMDMDKTLAALAVESVEGKRADPPVDVVSPEPWLRSLVFTTLCQQLLMLDIDEIDAGLREWIDDVQRANELLAPLAKTLSLHALEDEMQSLLVLLHAGVRSDAVSVGDVRSALDRVATGQLKVIHDLLSQCPVGTEVMVSASIVVQGSERDELLDQRLDAAVHALQDSRLPAEKFVMYEVDGSFPVETTGVSHTNMIRNERGEMPIVGILEESLYSVQEALNFLSPRRVDETVSRLDAWLKSIGSIALLVDKFLSIMTMHVASCAELDVMIGWENPANGDVAKTAEHTPKQYMDIVTELALRMESDAIADEMPFIAWVQLLETFMSGGPWMGLRAATLLGALRHHPDCQPQAPQAGGRVREVGQRYLQAVPDVHGHVVVRVGLDRASQPRNDARVLSGDGDGAAESQARS